MTKELTEREFLIAQAVRLFNQQRGSRINPKDCKIKSIVKNYGCSQGYEVVIPHEPLRLRLYFNLADRSIFAPYRLEVDGTDRDGVISDEIQVAIGSLSAAARDSGMYRFAWLEAETWTELFTFIDGSIFEFLDGTKAEYVEI